MRPPVEKQNSLEDLSQNEHHSIAIKECPFCAETINAKAKKCRFCGELLNELFSATSRGSKGSRRPASMPSAGLSETLGWILVGLPAGASFLIWFWVGNMNLFQNPSSSLGLLVFATVILTSILMAVEASQLGMGRIEFNGKRGTSPAGWLFSGLLFWIVAYPVYMRARLHYGVASRLLVGSLVAVLFAGSAALMGVAIETRKADVGNAIFDIADAFGGSNSTAPRRPPIVTRTEYQRIQNGWSYDEVALIIGAAGEEMSRNRIEGIDGVMDTVETVMYQWVNPNGSNMNAIFQNDKLVQKAQFDLP